MRRTLQLFLFLRSHCPAANVWIWLFGFIGNYFWTHYFFTVLGSSYSFPVHIKLNEIPFFLFLITHAYFISYHAFSTVLLRRWWTSITYQKMSNFFCKSQILVNVCSGRFTKVFFSTLIVFLLAYFTALAESVTIAEVGWVDCFVLFCFFRSCRSFLSRSPTGALLSTSQSCHDVYHWFRFLRHLLYCLLSNVLSVQQFFFCVCCLLFLCRRACV